MQVDITCVDVRATPDGLLAWLGGVVTRGTFYDAESGGTLDLAGIEVVLGALDAGRSAEDPPDQISFTLPFTGLDCHSAHEALPVAEFFFEMPQGQVTIR